MKIEGEHIFAATQEVVWPMLQDPTILASVLPGCEKLEQVGENEYEGVLKIRVGPVQGVFNGNIRLENIDAPHGYALQVDGRGPAGFVRGTGGVRLAQDGGSTVMNYNGDVQVGGRIASVGQRLLDTSARAVIRQSLEGLDEQVAARTQVHTTAIGGNAGDTAVSPTAPPSQTRFALGVAKNVVDELLPPEQRTSTLAKIGIALSAIILLKWLNDWWTTNLARKVARILREETR